IWHVFCEHMHRTSLAAPDGASGTKRGTNERKWTMENKVMNQTEAAATPAAVAAGAAPSGVLVEPARMQWVRDRLCGGSLESGLGAGRLDRCHRRSCEGRSYQRTGRERVPDLDHD
ncbi:hypothetical protein, partial [Nonomuraea zeae]|uniref:hypothetical protein n=1 Tax=Nonomuraea zeae TaxID=1642303 RepID=UPI00197EC0EF